MKISSNRLIVVLGMHRSGTSAITRGLKVLGVDLGDSLMAPIDGNNARGFWEDTHLNALNIEMLNAIESEWTHVGAIYQTDVEILHKQGYFLRAVDLLQKKVSGSLIFAFKDPRVAKLLLFWKTVFTHCKLDVSYVLAIRNPLSVAQSLDKRDGLNTEQSYLLWLSYVLASLTHSAGNKRVIVDFDSLMKSPENELKRIANHLELEIDITELNEYKINFLNEELRHTLYEINDLLLDQTCPPIVQEIYSALLDVASDKSELNELNIKIVQWTKEFERLKSPLMLIDKLYLQKVVANQAVLERDSRIVNLNLAVTECDGRIANLNLAVAEHNHQIANHNLAIAEHDHQTANHNLAVAERDHQIANLNQAVAEHDHQIANHNQAVAERDYQIANLNQAVAERDHHIANLNQAVTEHDHQIANLNQAVAERDGQVANLNQAVVERDGQVANLNQAVAERDGQVANLNQAVVERDGQVANLNQAVAEHDIQSSEALRIVKEIRNSTSWKITKPLREIRRFLSHPKIYIRLRIIWMLQRARCIYRSLPITNQTKVKHLMFINRYFPDISIHSSNNLGLIENRFTRLLSKKINSSGALELPNNIDITNTSASYQLAVAPLSKDQIAFIKTDNPIVSIVILQYYKSHLTINCLRSIIRYTSNQDVEIVVVDNGSSKEHLEAIKKEFGDYVTLLDIGVNRYYGEGNNIGIEAARGEHVVIMNNDIAVTSNWLSNLMKKLTDDVGAIGPCFLYPDDRIQECGGFIDVHGNSIQKLKGGDISQIPTEDFECDYVSGALLLMRKTDFYRIGGFDLCYEPAYYEDVDLCFKLLTYGLKTICVPSVVIYHNENATSSDASLGLNLSNIVEVNKQKFIDRWQQYLTLRCKDQIQLLKVVGASAYPLSSRIEDSENSLQKRTMLIYTPYTLIPGGGEKYLLSVAQTFSDDYKVTLACPHTYSYVRIAQMAKYLDLDLSKIKLAGYSEDIFSKVWDVAFVIGNSIAPPFKAPGKKSFYICQFPFDRLIYKNKAIPYVKDYKYICYSEFVKKHICENEFINEGNVEIIAPAIQSFENDQIKQNIIVSVGRFFTGGHCKNQHLLIGAFKLLIQNKEFSDWKLILVGSTRPEPEHRLYYKKCVDLAKGFNIEIIPDATHLTLRDVYAKSKYYWHGAGLEVNPVEMPEQLEHFGITPLEAATAGCIVFVPDAGGPGDIAKMGYNNIIAFNTVSELVEASLSYSPEAKNVNNIKSLFDKESFKQNLINLTQKDLLND